MAYFSKSGPYVWVVCVSVLGFWLAIWMCFAKLRKVLKSRGSCYRVFKLWLIFSSSGCLWWTFWTGFPYWLRIPAVIFSYSPLIVGSFDTPFSYGLAYGRHGPFLCFLFLFFFFFLSWRMLLWMSLTLLGSSKLSSVSLLPVLDYNC